MQNRLTISLAGSTSSIGTGLLSGLSFSMPRSVQRFFDSSLSALAYSKYVLKLSTRTACCSLATVIGVPLVIFAVAAVLIQAADIEHFAFDDRSADTPGDDG